MKTNGINNNINNINNANNNMNIANTLQIEESTKLNHKIPLNNTNIREENGVLNKTLLLPTQNSFVPKLTERTFNNLQFKNLDQLVAELNKNNYDHVTTMFDILKQVSGLCSEVFKNQKNFHAKIQNDKTNLDVSINEAQRSVLMLMAAAVSGMTEQIKDNMEKIKQTLADKEKYMKEAGEASSEAKAARAAAIALSLALVAATALASVAIIALGVTIVGLYVLLGLAMVFGTDAAVKSIEKQISDAKDAIAAIVIGLKDLANDIAKKWNEADEAGERENKFNKLADKMDKLATQLTDQNKMLNVLLTAAINLYDTFVNNFSSENERREEMGQLFGQQLSDLVKQLSEAGNKLAELLLKLQQDSVGKEKSQHDEHHSKVNVNGKNIHETDDEENYKRKLEEMLQEMLYLLYILIQMTSPKGNKMINQVNLSNHINDLLQNSDNTLQQLQSRIKLQAEEMV